MVGGLNETTHKDETRRRVPGRCSRVFMEERREAQRVASPEESFSLLRDGVKVPPRLKSAHLALGLLFLTDTWDHFKIPDCDPGPPEGTKKWVTTVENVKTWVNDTIGAAPAIDENGGHWVDGHIEYPGHYEMKPRNVSRWVVVHKTAKQQDCFYKQKPPGT
eukprot:g11867.t1